MRIGIDLGGTKIEGLALEGGRELARTRVTTPRGDYRATVEAIVSVVDHLERTVGARGTVGVGMPGTISPASGLVKNANSVWLIEQPFAQDLEAALARPVRLANDANCFALSEAVDGAAAGAEVVFGVILGTGTGGGVVVRRHVLPGPNAVAGEWGHNPMPWPEPGEWPGPRCYCGRTGCIETFLSGPGFARDHAEASGERLSGPEIVERVETGDAAAIASLRRYEARLARALASVVNVLDPDVIVLGGGLSAIPSLYVEVPRLWAPFVFSDTVRTRIVPPRFGDSSGVHGAAWLWEEP
jgi:fructokinase